MQTVKFDVPFPVRNGVIVIADGDHIRRVPLGPLSEQARIISFEDSNKDEPNYVPPKPRTHNTFWNALFALALVSLFLHFTGWYGLAAIIILVLLTRRH